MATEKPITTETVALTEKKMDMSLDEIIKMEKSSANVNNGKKQRASNKKEKFNGGVAKNSAVKAQRYMNSRSDVRQGAFARRRTNFQGNQFPVTTVVARKAASGTPRGRPYNAGRMTTNTNQSRFITPPVQNRSVQRGFVAKQHQQQQRVVNIEQKQANGQRQWPQTLDSRFASMKEERMRMSRFVDNRSNGGNNGAGLYQQQQQRSTVPWGRRATRFPN
ncbi:PREDICTED: uncharacterized protein LOC104707385 [Camelina sativa]|uniref:Uncharacterized protein LOC104707385 n=1 Tax=Camelina sativa TaxID=90675 RepID=A0ABM0T7H2_CAMSA|nr:PREDICTED: uncharacterized protein LOC104707385 [Camelina sativa]XP_010422029.1 PREDICTED: uncharacterized protein LOC104707385 [Camelina sativa]